MEIAFMDKEFAIDEIIWVIIKHDVLFMYKMCLF